jgi:hypothetical protein
VDFSSSNISEHSKVALVPESVISGSDQKPSSDTPAPEKTATASPATKTTRPHATDEEVELRRQGVLHYKLLRQTTEVIAKKLGVSADVVRDDISWWKKHDASKLPDPDESASLLDQSIESLDNLEWQLRCSLMRLPDGQAKTNCAGQIANIHARKVCLLQLAGRIPQSAININANVNVEHTIDPEIQTEMRRILQYHRRTIDVDPKKLDIDMGD